MNSQGKKLKILTQRSCVFGFFHHCYHEKVMWAGKRAQSMKYLPYKQEVLNLDLQFHMKNLDVSITPVPGEVETVGFLEFTGQLV